MLLQQDDQIKIENETVSVALFPQLGGKIVSFKYIPAQFEVLSRPARPFQTAGYGAWFENYDLCGLDDLFPCIDGETLQVGGRSVDYPDHGEIWSASMEWKIEENRVRLYYESPRLPYRYEKTVSLEGPALRLDYRIWHTGGEPFPCLWAFHGLVRHERRMKLLYPRGAGKIETAMDSELLGKAGALIGLDQPTEYDFFTVPEKQTMLKYYLEDRLEEGRCGYIYPQGIRCTLEFDPKKLPYLGFWLCSGELGGAYHCAFEPANGYYDAISTAQRKGRCPALSPGDIWEFTLRLRLEKS